MEMSDPYLFINEGESDRLYVFYDNSEVECNWYSENEEVATVKDGLVTAKKTGTAEAGDGTVVSSMVIVNALTPQIIESPTPIPSNSTEATPTTAPIQSPEPSYNPMQSLPSMGEPTISPSKMQEGRNSTDVIEKQFSKATGMKRQKISVSRIKTYKVKKLKKTAVSFRIKAKTNGDGKILFVNTTSKKLKKYIKVSRNGKVKLKKGSKKGTYKIKIIATKTNNFRKSIKTLKIIVK